MSYSGESHLEFSSDHLKEMRLQTHHWLPGHEDAFQDKAADLGTHSQGQLYMFCMLSRRALETYIYAEICEFY